MDNIEQTLKETFNTYANQYNKSDNKISITNSLNERYSTYRNELKSIRNRLDKYGFAPELVKMIVIAGRDNHKNILKAHNEALQEFVDVNNFTEDEFNRIMKQIEENVRQYELTDVESTIIEYILKKTARDGYPDSIPFFNDLSEKQQAEIGRPLKKKEIRNEVVKYYLKNYPDQNIDEQLAQSILSELDDKLGISKEYADPARTIKYWINKY